MGRHCGRSDPFRRLPLRGYHPPTVHVQCPKGKIPFKDRPLNGGLRLLLSPILRRGHEQPDLTDVALCRASEHHVSHGVDLKTAKVLGLDMPPPLLAAPTS